MFDMLLFTNYIGCNTLTFKGCVIDLQKKKKSEKISANLSLNVSD